MGSGEFVEPRANISKHRQLLKYTSSFKLQMTARTGDSFIIYATTLLRENVLVLCPLIF